MNVAVPNAAPPRTLPSWALPACRLWQRHSPSGSCLAGVWGGVRVLIYANPDKRDAEDADFILAFSARVPPSAAKDTCNQQKE